MDTTNIDLKALWANQKVEEPSLNDLLEKIKRYRKSSRRQTLRTSIGLIATGAFILFIWYYFQPQFLTTKIGIVVVIADIALYVIAINRIAALFKKTEEATSNQEYLKSLLEIKARQQVVHGQVLNLYFILLSTGIALYMYEYTSRMSSFGALATYGITTGWILLNWFYFRPMMIHKQQSKLNDLIANLERIQSQLNDKE